MRKWFQRLDSEDGDDSVFLPVKITFLDEGEQLPDEGVSTNRDRDVSVHSMDSHHQFTLNTTMEDQEVMVNPGQQHFKDPSIQTQQRRFRRKCIVCLLFLLLLGATLVGAGLGLRAKKQSQVPKTISQSDAPTSFGVLSEADSRPETIEPMSPETTTTQSPPLDEEQEEPEFVEAEDFSERMNAFHDVLVSSQVSDPALFQKLSVQWRTLIWLAEGDDAALDPWTSPETEITERYVAALLYYSTSGGKWTNASNFLSKDPICQWNYGGLIGILCDEDDTVTEITLIKNGLQGSLPSELSYFRDIKRLNIYYNSLTGTIPDFGSMTSLETIDLDGNVLMGRVPESFFSLPALQELLLLNNRGLTGSIPDISPSSPLRKISFYNCGLTGSIPESLGLVTGLEFLQFYNNGLTGTIPESVTKLPNLEVFGFRRNQLKGSIPSFAGQSNLRTISLGENNFQGNLPTGMDGMTSLKNFNVQRNSLSGRILNQIESSLPALENVWLFGNELEGPVPLFSGNDGSLTQFFISNNQFVGDMQTILAELPSSIMYLDVSDNVGIGGSLTSQVSRFNSLIFFNVSHTQITGTVPLELSAINSLESFSVQSTGISGSLTSTFCDGGEMEWLSADCGQGGSVACECCTECCTDNVFGTECTPN